MSSPTIFYEFVAMYKVYSGSYSSHKKTVLQEQSHDNALKKAYINAIINNAKSTKIDFFFGTREETRISKDMFESIPLSEIIEYYEKNKEDNCEKWIWDFRGLYKRPYVHLCTTCGMIFSEKGMCEACGEQILRFSSKELFKMPS